MIQRRSRHAQDGRRKIGAVVEIEAAQVVLVRLALATVLADDEARHGLEQLSGSHQRARGYLSRRHDTLTRGFRGSDESLARRIHLREVPEPPRAGHGDIGREHERKHDVDHASLGRAHRHARLSSSAEVGERDDDVIRAGNERRDLVSSQRVAGRRRDTGASARPHFTVAPGSRPPVWSVIVPLMVADRSGCCASPVAWTSTRATHGARTERSRRWRIMFASKKKPRVFAPAGHPNGVARGGP
jgi:hypothetical protein